MGPLDTGADQTTIPLVTAQELRLRQIGDSDVKGATGAWESRPLYAVDISFGGLAFPSVVVMAIDYPVVLIGRDILNDLVVTFDGPNATFTIAKP
jgi:predicted aspartyl protease